MLQVESFQVWSTFKYLIHSLSFDKKPVISDRALFSYQPIIQQPTD